VFLKALRAALPAFVVAENVASVTPESLISAEMRCSVTVFAGAGAGADAKAGAGAGAGAGADAKLELEPDAKPEE